MQLQLTNDEKKDLQILWLILASTKKELDNLNFRMQIAQEEYEDANNGYIGKVEELAKKYSAKKENYLGADFRTGFMNFKDEEKVNKENIPDGKKDNDPTDGEEGSSTVNSIGEKAQS